MNRICAKKMVVAGRFPFNQKKMKDWCQEEGSPETFEELMKKIKSNTN